MNDRTKTTLLEVTNIPTNNTQLRIQKKRDANDTSRKTGSPVVFDDVNLRSGFAQVPNVVLYDPLLGIAAKLCYILLLSYAWQKDRCFPSQKLLGENMSCTVRTTRRALTELQKHRLISVERAGLGKPNTYHIKKLNNGYLPKGIVDKGANF